MKKFLLRTKTKNTISHGYYKSNNSDVPRQGGFTLLELLIAISLLAITAGVTGDIILNIVRSYNKTKITNEIEQSGNIALAKMEKELKTATLITIPNPPEDTCNQTITFLRKRSEDQEVIDVTYAIQGGSLLRTEKDSEGVVGPIPVIDATQPDGVRLDSGSQFCILNQTSPYVVQIHFDLIQASSTGNNSFLGDIKLDQTVVLRGTY